MHTFQHEGTTFNFNSDLSGYVEIRNDDRVVNVLGSSLLAFVAEHVRREKVREIEQASQEDLLYSNKAFR